MSIQSQLNQEALEWKTYKIIAKPESGYVEDWGLAEAKNKALSHLASCYYEYELIDIIDVTDAGLSRSEIEKNLLH